MTDDQRDSLDDLIAEFCRRAQTYGCDAVQVLLSVHDEKAQETHFRRYGRGNWYARQGMAQDFLLAAQNDLQEAKSDGC